MTPATSLSVLAALISLLHQETTADQGGACSKEPEEAALEFGYHCVHDLVDEFRSRGGRSFPSNFYYLDAWNKTCSGLTFLPNCIENIEAFKACGNVKRTEFFRAAKDFVKSEWARAGFHLAPGTCSTYAPMYNKNISLLYTTPSDVCRQLITDTIDMCVEDWLIAVAVSSDSAGNAPFSVAHEVYTCAVGRSPTKCGPAGRNLAKFIVDQTMPDDIRNNISMIDITNHSYNASIVDRKAMLLSERHSVGVFGDPHLITFRGYKLQSCEITGTRDYLVNRFFRVSGTAEHVRHPKRGSALTELTISFYDADGQVSAEYTARGGTLPTLLNDGQPSGFMAGNMDITLSEGGSELIRIRVVDLGVVFHILAWNGYYSLALRAATALFRESSGLLVDGCDYKDTIDIYVVNSRSKRDAVSECEEACSTLNDTKLFSFTGVCIYDCITAQDPQIAAMTMQFQRTLSSIENEDRLLPLIPVIVVGAQNSDATTPCPSLLLTLIFVLGSLHRWT